MPTSNIPGSLSTIYMIYILAPRTCDFHHVHRLITHIHEPHKHWIADLDNTLVKPRIIGLAQSTEKHAHIFARLRRTRVPLARVEARAHACMTAIPSFSSVTIGAELDQSEN
uniref:Uncharacterized protein n=1 Tax=Cacopsylla melanoneura TaxID=428564 RepID=A0A8D9AZQ5_9HEMI